MDRGWGRWEMGDGGGGRWKTGDRRWRMGEVMDGGLGKVNGIIFEQSSSSTRGNCH